MISIRLDDSILEWFKANAPDGYQKSINAVLKDFQYRATLREQHLLGRAQQIFIDYHARCFWHLKKDLVINSSHIPMIQAGLRKFAGLEGMRLADEIDLTHARELNHAHY